MRIGDGGVVRLALAGVLTLAAMAPSAAIAQASVSDANALYRNIRMGDGEPGDRSDLHLIPAIAVMESAPIGADTPERARLLKPGMAAWENAAAWASGPAQQRVLEKLRLVTEEIDPSFAMGYGQPYGQDALLEFFELGLDEEVFDAILERGLITEIDVGGTALLAAADRSDRGVPTVYRWLAPLVHVEATRLYHEGDIIASLRLLSDYTFFGRQIADRQLRREKIYGLSMMVDGLERMRDIAYTDFRSQTPQLASSSNWDPLIRLLDRMADRSRDNEPGFLELDRLGLPRASWIAARQLARHTLDSNGARPGVFNATMARLGGGDDPLRMLATASTWGMYADRQKSQSDSLREIEDIIGDIRLRWQQDDPFHRIMRTPFTVERVNLQENVPAYITLYRTEVLFNLRRIVRTEIAGTRLALAVVGNRYRTGGFARTPASVRPTWLFRLDADPFNPASGGQPLQLFVPGRDIRSRVHEINVIIEGAPNFARNIADDEFVVYSVGADGVANLASRVQNSVSLVQGADYLIWPPVLSLQRLQLDDLGELR